MRFFKERAIKRAMVLALSGATSGLAPIYAGAEIVSSIKGSMQSMPASGGGTVSYVYFYYRDSPIDSYPDPDTACHAFYGNDFNWDGNFCRGPNYSDGLRSFTACPSGYSDNGAGACAAPATCPDTWSLSGDKTSCTKQEPARCPDPLYALSADEQSCTKPNERKRDAGHSCTKSGNPINYTTGNKYQIEHDWRGRVLSFRRVYNSTSGSVRSLGYAWQHNYDKHIDWNPATPNIAWVLRDDGKVLPFTFADGKWSSSADINDQLTQLKDSAGNPSGWQYQIAGDRSSESYDVAGKLVRVQQQNGQSETLRYSDANTPTTVAPRAGLLIGVADQWSSELGFNYDTSNRIVSMTDAAGGTSQYSYDAAGNLASVTYPDGKTRQYLYENASFPHALTGLIDENGARYASWSYDNAGRAVSSEHGEGIDKVVISYATDGRASVTDALGASRDYPFTELHGLGRATGASQPGGSGCAAASSKISYDPNGNVTAKTDFNGVSTTYQYDTARNLETQRVEAAGTAQARTISTQWHATLRLPVKIAQPKLLETFSYDANGNLVGKTAQATSDANGSAGSAATTSGPLRSWSYSYNQYGQVVTVKDPRGATTQYRYDGQGNLTEVANPLGQITSFAQYNAFGHPGRVTNPNGVVTAYSYDARGRLLESARYASADPANTVSKTQYRYDGVGNLTHVTLPDGGTLSYSYDAAHRLVGMSDNLGNQTRYTLDKAGNRTQIKVSDPNGNLAQQQNRLYDQLGRLQQTIGQAGHSVEYQYDANGNLTRSSDNLNRVSHNQYDPLNRLIKQTDPLGGSTQYGYDLLDQLTAVTDPRGLATSYTVDGLGNRSLLQSPDTGKTSYAYDAAGQLTQKTDARGKTAQYSYDALGRPTRIAYPDQTISYSWDSPTKGKLAQTTDSSGTTQYRYDALERVAEVSRTLPAGSASTAALNVRYVYDAAGRVLQQTLPSGQVLDYQYQNGRLTGIDRNGQPLVGNIQYHPFGGVQSYRYNGSQQYLRQQDQDGRVSTIHSPALAKQYGYDAASRLNQIADAEPARSQNYGYDALDRLTDSVRGASTWGYRYDAVGNRTQASINGSTVSYQYSASSNQLVKKDKLPLSYDAAGNLLQEGHGKTGDSYDDAGRLRLSQTGKGKTRLITSYSYAEDGKRIVKSNTRYAYDQWGHLLGEYTLDGKAITEYVWLGDEAVAVLKY